MVQRKNVHMETNVNSFIPNAVYSHTSRSPSDYQTLPIIIFRRAILMQIRSKSKGNLSVFHLTTIWIFLPVQTMKIIRENKLCVVQLLMYPTRCHLNNNSNNNSIWCHQIYCIINHISIDLFPDNMLSLQAHLQLIIWFHTCTSSSSNNNSFLNPTVSTIFYLVKSISQSTIVITICGTNRDNRRILQFNMNHQICH